MNQQSHVLHLPSQDYTWGTFPLDEGTFTGRWSNKYQKPDGYGTLVYNISHPKYQANNWQTYAGQWLYGKPNGHGTMLYRSGARYSGGWRDGKRHGDGVMTYSPSRVQIVFVGTYDSDNRKEGMLCTVGSDIVASYTGKFRNSEFHDENAWTVCGAERSH
jgi:hypothetical protein